jgi:hypothetical protein
MHKRRLVKLPVHRRRRAKRKSSSHIIEPSQPKHCKISRGHHVIAGGVLLVAIVLISLSLNHLTNGVAIMTGVGQQSSWVMAVEIDLGFIALELAMLVSPDHIGRCAI